jgi:hypothetical protein
MDPGHSYLSPMTPYGPIHWQQSNYGRLCLFLYTAFVSAILWFVSSPVWPCKILICINFEIFPIKGTLLWLFCNLFVCSISPGVSGVCQYGDEKGFVNKSGRINISNGECTSYRESLSSSNLYLNRSVFPTKILVSIKVFCVHAMKAYRGTRNMTPLILKLGTRLIMNGQPHAPANLPPGK